MLEIQLLERSLRETVFAKSMTLSTLILSNSALAVALIIERPQIARAKHMMAGRSLTPLVEGHAPSLHA